MIRGGRGEVRLNILNPMVMLKFFGKPPLLRCGESYAFRVTQSDVQLRHLSGCDESIVDFEVYIY